MISSSGGKVNIHSSSDSDGQGRENVDGATFTNPFNSAETVQAEKGDGDKNSSNDGDDGNNADTTSTSTSFPNRRHSTLQTTQGIEIETPENDALKKDESEPEPDVAETGPAKQGGGPRKGSLAGERVDNKNPWTEDRNSK
ncbi:hypothetical protein E3P99_03874 [Wallemia hederae]|uniref:Uncharacterized protein n=1 Tax=Wallemia hederae TaxID=1540922 RepID=A0A4T0FDA5_9BASI|nr:hypothetical protein E3P99_03874 [Wallemia hederae]